MKIIHKNYGVNEELNERRLSQLQGIIKKNSKFIKLSHVGTHPPHYTTVEILIFEDKYEDEIGFKVFSHILKKQTPQIMLHLYFFSPEKLALLPLLEEIKPSPNRKMIKLLS